MYTAAKKAAGIVGTSGEALVVASHLIGARKWRLSTSTRFVGDDRMCNGVDECPFVSKNFVLPGEDVNDGNICNVLDNCDSESTEDNDSAEFLELDATALVSDKMGRWENVEGKCGSMDATEVFGDMNSRCGKYEFVFDCRENENICNCLQWAGAQSKPIMFTRGSDSLSFFKEGDQLQYELKCGKGKKHRRRKFVGGGGC